MNRRYSSIQVYVQHTLVGREASRTRFGKSFTKSVMHRRRIRARLVLAAAVLAGVMMKWVLVDTRNEILCLVGTSSKLVVVTRHLVPLGTLAKLLVD